MSSLDSLWELQEIRKQYLTLKKREQAALENPEVKTLKEKLTAAQGSHDVKNQRMKGMEKNIKKLEMDCKALEDKKGSLQEELYSGKGNMKELSSMQQRLEKTKEELSVVEEDLMRFSEEIDQLQENVSGLQQEIVGLDSQLGVMQANLEVELQEIRHQIDEVKNAHGAVMKIIDRKSLDLYNKKFKQFSVTTMAKMSGGVCTGCNVHLPRYLIAEVKKRDGLVGCENCGRILYYSTQSELR